MSFVEYRLCTGAPYASLHVGCMYIQSSWEAHYQPLEASVPCECVFLFSNFNEHCYGKHLVALESWVGIDTLPMPKTPNFQ